MTAPEGYEFMWRVCAKHGITIEKLHGKSKARALVDIRQEIALEAARSRWTMMAIGELLRRDHTSVLNLLQRPTPMERPAFVKQSGVSRWRQWERTKRVDDACSDVLP